MRCKSFKKLLRIMKIYCFLPHYLTPSQHKLNNVDTIIGYANFFIICDYKKIIYSCVINLIELN